MGKKIDGENTLSSTKASKYLIQIGARSELFYSGDKKSWTRLNGTAVDLKSQKFKNYLSKIYYAETEKVASEASLKEAIGVLIGRATFDGNEKKVSKRTAGNDDCILIDLINQKRELVKITKDGVTVSTHLSETEFNFTHKDAMLELCHPVAGGDINILKKYLNLNRESEDQWILVLSWLVSAFFPTGPYSILVVSGEQGSGKSTTSTFLRSIVDPSFLELRTPPRNEEDIALAAENSWILAYDNLSGISNNVSDALCRVACNGGFAKRTLYTDGNETMFRYQRPVLLNGIDDLVTREDLLSRSIIVNLPRLSGGIRKSEEELKNEFEKDLPLILGEIFRAISYGLSKKATIDLKESPRMKDFIVNSTACLMYWGYDEKAVLDAYNRNKTEFIRYGVESNPVSEALYRHMTNESEWIGNGTKLLALLKDVVDEEYRYSKYFPKTAKAVKKLVRRCAPSFRSLGISVDEYREGSTGQRLIHFINKNNYIDGNCAADEKL